MNHKRNIIFILALSILFTFFGYLADNDLSYPNFWHTVIEFVMLSLIVSAIFGVFYLIIWGIASIPTKKI